MTNKDRIKILEKEYAFTYVVLGLYSKACKTFRSIHILCTKSLGEDANALLRILMEICVNLFYIAEDKQKRTQLFLYKMIKSSKRLGDRIKSNKKLRDISIPKESWEKVKETYKETQQNHPKEILIERIKTFIIGNIFHRPVLRISTWSGESLQNMAYKTGLREIYDLINPFSSMSVHGEDLLDHISFDETAGITLNVIPGDKWVNPVLSPAILIFLTIVNEINSLFELGKDKELQVFFDKFKKFKE